MHDAAPRRSGSFIEIINDLTSNPDVAKITLTGSTSIGLILAEKSARTLMRVSMGLGGNAPFIVFDDADPNVPSRAR